MLDSHGLLLFSITVNHVLDLVPGCKQPSLQISAIDPYIGDWSPVSSAAQEVRSGLMASGFGIGSSGDAVHVRQEVSRRYTPEWCYSLAIALL